MKERNNDNLEDLKKKLLNSPAINSLKQELSIYNKFTKLGWEVDHSPYYTDSTTGKFREVDISARRYWIKKGKKEFSFGVNFIVECKTINDYHVVFCNQCDGVYNLEDDWIGEDSMNHYSETIKLLQKHNIKDSDIQETLNYFNKHLYPKGRVRYGDYRLDSFEIPTFCSFRETNIGMTKDMENSVVWKSYQSLYSVIRSYQANKFKDIDYELYNIENEKYLTTYEARLNELKEELIYSSNHFELFHPVLVVESKLWDFNEDKIEELKYGRLVFQEMSGFSTWIDIVAHKHLDEYLQKSKEYVDFFKMKRFKSS
jgi:hypothetical protein